MALKTNKEGAAQIALVRGLERLDQELVHLTGQTGGLGRVRAVRGRGTLRGRADLTPWPPRLFIHRLIGLVEVSER